VPHPGQQDQHPRLAELLATDPAARNAPTVPAGAEPPDQGTPGEGTRDRYADIMARVLTGLLAPA
jgi:hypothetical protein